MGNCGRNGTNQNCGGRNGSNITIKVPVGTLVYDIPELSKQLLTNPNVNFGLTYVPVASLISKNFTKILIGDMDVEGKTLQLVAGGKGGRGNHDIKKVDIVRTGTKGEAKVIVSLLYRDP